MTWSFNEDDKKWFHMDAEIVHRKQDGKVGTSEGTYPWKRGHTKHFSSSAGTISFFLNTSNFYIF